METAYEQSTLDVEESHWWYRGRRRIVVDTVRALELPRPAAVLDAGCGSGRNLVELSAFGELTGVEPSPVSAERARARGIATIVEAGLEDVPLPDSSFDLVTCLDVIEHIDDDAGALRELRRLTRPGGMLLVTVPAYPRLWSSHDELNQHRRRYTRRILVERAAQAGWTLRRTTHFNSLLLPAAAAARLAERLRPPKEPRSELERTPAALNRLLEQPLRAEAALLRSGRGIPFGLSLLAVLAADRGERQPPVRT